MLPAPLAFAFKPLTTLLILAFAWPRGADAPKQRRFIRIGLLLSLIGDVFRMWPKAGFLPGLIAFLLAHLAYIAAFTVPLRLAARPLVFVGCGVVALLILVQLRPGIAGALRRARRRAVHGVGQPARDQQVRRAAAVGVAVDPGDLLVRAGVHRVGAARALRRARAPAL